MLKINPSEDLFWDTKSKIDFSRVVYRGVTGSFFGIGILPVSDLLDFRYFGRIDPPLFCILPPFPPPFFPKGG